MGKRRRRRRQEAAPSEGTSGWGTPAKQADWEEDETVSDGRLGVGERTEGGIGENADQTEPSGRGGRRRRRLKSVHPSASNG